MGKTIVCVPLIEPCLGAWLGPKRVVQWLLDKLPCVHGVDSVVGLTVSRPGAWSSASANKVMETHGHSTVAVPEGIDHKSDATLLQWACAGGPAKNADSVLYLSGCTPFLAVLTVERCLTAIDDDTSYMMLGRKVKVLDYKANGRYLVGDGFSPLAGIRAGAVSRFSADCNEWPRTIVEVEVRPIEAIDVSVPDMLSVACALVQNGIV